MTAPTALHIVYPSYPATPAGVIAALALLGATPDQVARALAQRGYLGQPGEGRDCPIAVYLHDTLTPTWPVSVGEATVAVWANTERVDVHLPDPVRRFITAFDAGAYTFLHPDGIDATNTDTGAAEAVR